MDSFRKLMKGNVAGWRRTSGGRGTNRKLVHRRVRRMLQRLITIESES